MAKSARKAMKDKAKRLTTDPHVKVDASDWTPSEPLNADAQTGPRPVSRRAFKKGGKVMGEPTKMHAGRKPRKSGGSAKANADAKVNRNVKDANAEKFGSYHVGGFKKGGRAGKDDGGVAEASRIMGNAPIGPDDEKPSNPTSALKGPVIQQTKESLRPSAMERIREQMRPAQKRGGRTGKADGGAMSSPPMTDPRMRAAQMMQNAGAVGGVPSSTMNFSRVQKGALSPMRAAGMKKGGFANWEGSKKDESQDRKLAKKHGMSMKAWEGSKLDEKHDKQHSEKGLKSGGRTGKKSGGATESIAEAIGSRPTGGRIARKSGGKVGKSHINILINAGQKPQDGQAPAGGPPMGNPPGIPMPVPSPMGAAPAGMPMPMPAPPMGMPPGMPPMPPMPAGRMAGGRVGKFGGGAMGGHPMGGMPMGMPQNMGNVQGPTSPSYGMGPGQVNYNTAPPQMPIGMGGNRGVPNAYGAIGGGVDAGPMARKPFKKGGKVYPKMKFGAGSGEGRLEKIEEYGLKSKK